MAKWLLLDGFNLAFRSFYAIPELSRSDGFPTNAIHGWLRTLWILEDREKPDHMVLFFDLGAPKAREALLASYKAQRKETPKDLVAQIPWLKKIAESLGCPIVEQSEVEADDLIASAAFQLKKEGHQAFIVSADKDFAQCIQPNITQILPPPTVNPKLGWRVLDKDGVLKKFGVPPAKIVDYLALIGDVSDNIPGVEGVGPKTATCWISEYGSVEGIIKKANYLKPVRFQVSVPKCADRLRTNVKLITLDTALDVGSLEKQSPQPQQLCEILKIMEMKTSLRDACKRFNLPLPS